ncbi:MAG: phosphoribosylformylglycinamidine synthase subunit PurL, partial [Flavobacteriales bacterium]|nr:phosphoribosylformylglycinamidine synthase subunit PurL [Flavobacteriales bacterium]
ACTGGEPCGVTNCLNFGNPYDPEVYWQFAQAIKGMGDACRAYDTPVTGGNVSFYNHTVTEQRNIPVFPTPTIGMVGIVPDISRRMSLDFKQKGDLIYLLGNSTDDIACSEYLTRIHKIERSPAPYFDIEEESRLHTMLLILIRKGVINAAHDISDGGLWTTLVEMAMPRGLGFDVITDSEIREDAFLFGEGQGRAVVAVNDEQETAFLDLMQASRVPCILLGHVTKGKISVDDAPFGTIDDVRKVYEEAVPKAMAQR